MEFSIGDLVKISSRNNAIGYILKQVNTAYRVIYFGKTIYGSKFAITDDFDSCDLKLANNV